MKEYVKAHITAICFVLLSFALIFSIYQGKLEKQKNDIMNDCLPKYSWLTHQYHEAELKYWEIKSQLVDEVQNYVDEKAPMNNLRMYEVVDKCEEHKIDLKFVTAQAEIESCFGTKGLAKKTNSVWNVMAFDSLKFDEIHYKGIYKHPNDSVNPYFELLLKRYLVKKNEYQLMERFTDKDGRRYASDKNYEIKLKSKFEELSKITKIDSLSSLMNHYAIQCGRF